MFTLLTTTENTITYHNALCLSPQNFAYALSSVSLGAILLLRETEDYAYVNFRGDKQRALWHVMVFSVVVNTFAPTRQSCGIGLLLTHKNGDFGATYGTERRGAAPISKVERHISDRFCATLLKAKPQRQTSEGQPDL